MRVSCAYERQRHDEDCAHVVAGSPLRGYFPHGLRLPSPIVHMLKPVIPRIDGARHGARYGQLGLHLAVTAPRRFERRSRRLARLLLEEFLAPRR